MIVTVFVLCFLQGAPFFCLWVVFVPFFFPLAHCFCYGWVNTELAVPVSSHTVFVLKGGLLNPLFPVLCHRFIVSRQVSLFTDNFRKVLWM